MAYISDFIKITDIQNGGRFDLPHAIDGGYIAFWEITFYPAWTKISRDRTNDTFTLDETFITIPPGYYSVCALYEEVFKPLGVSMDIKRQLAE